MIQVEPRTTVWSIGIFLLVLGATFTLLIGADAEAGRTRSRSAFAKTLSPIVEDDWKYHRVGTLWNRVTNFSIMGDDAYVDRTPSCDYPGGSGNSYLYNGSIWLTARIDGVVYSSQGRHQEFAPLDSVTLMTGDGTVSEEDTYTRYYDVSAPLATEHTPLGLEVIERTYAWSGTYTGDFIIYEYTIKNVGLDNTGDGYPDSTRDITELYFSYRMDGDISKLPTWGAEDDFSNRDDHVLANGVPWDWIELFPAMAGRDHGLTADEVDSTLMFMWDGDNPSYDADNGQPDDFGNPAVDGALQSPGFLGFKILHTEPYLPPSSFHINHIYNDPATDQEAWDRMVGNTGFEDLFVNPADGIPYPHDYRGILTFGPLNTLKAGDSLIVTAALAVGSDPDSGGVYSLIKLIDVMNVAQFIVDNEYQISLADLIPPAPTVEVFEAVEDGKVTGVAVQWDDMPLSHANFAGFRVWKSSGKTAAGAYDWEPLGLGTYADTVNSNSWPPPAGTTPGTYQVIDNDIINGMDYFYAVQSYSSYITDPVDMGVTESNILAASSLKGISPANPVATSLDNIKVVPNPYQGSAVWNNPAPSDAFPWEHRIQFTNLPADAAVKIFTLAGDFVAETAAGLSVRKGGVSTDPSLSVAEWDLMTRNNQEAAPGVYLYVVESPSLGSKVGKFVIIR